MKRLLVLSCLAIMVTSGLQAQDCPLYYPDALNTQLVFQQFDKKGKLTGTMVQTITDFKNTEKGYEVKVTAENFDAKDKSLGTMNLTARCENGVYYIDMKNLLSAQSMEAYKDMEMKIEGGNLELPSSMKAGDMLKNGDMKITLASGGMTIMNMTYNVTNRKVEAIEEITTPAGTFECYKITYDLTAKIPVSIKGKGVEWYSKGVGLIKSESYSTDGALRGSTVLASIKK